jgi:hypothetical protein
MKLIEVKDKATAREFLDMVDVIYQDYDAYVRPLDVEIEGVFDPNENVFFNYGQCTRWILVDDAGQTIGRVAAFINEKKAHNFDQPTGGMGFFECIDNKEAANLLFEQCKSWLEERKMEAMDGPINFGENDRFWGLLVKGFTDPGYGLPFNPPYYQQLFEDYGFAFYFEQVSNHLDLTKPMPERFAKIGEWVARKPGYSFDHFRLNNAEKYIQDFITIYNDAWSFHENFTPIDPDDVRGSIAKMKPILVEEFIQFAYHEGEPIGFMLMIPDANQLIKHMNGKSNWWAKLKFAWYRWRKAITRARIIIMGVVPKFQKSGIESALIVNGRKVIHSMPQYKEVELSWVGDFNPKMRALHESTGAVLGKVHYTMRKLFKEGAEQGRSAIIARDTKEQALSQDQQEEE